MTRIYFDHMASTRIDPAVRDLMFKIYQDYPGNPSSEHIYGNQLKQLISKASQQIKTVVNGNDYNIVWTSGATEAINLAVLGSVSFYGSDRSTVLTFSTEHQATLRVFKQLEQKGYQTKVLGVDKSGLIDQEQLFTEVSNDTILVSICHVNNEIGTIQDINNLVQKLQKYGCLVHIDAAQTIGKTELDLQKCPADYISFSGHKFYGPQGIGALLVRKNRHLHPLLFGGQQQDYRPGTLPAALICGMGLAAELCNQDANIQKWQLELLQLFEDIGGVTVHGSLESRVAHNLNIHIAGVNSETFKLLNSNIALSSGSACHAQSPEPSHVLLALGYEREHAANSIRISLGRDLTGVDLQHFKQQFIDSVCHIRRLSGC